MRLQWPLGEAGGSRSTNFCSRRLMMKTNGLIFFVMVLLAGGANAGPDNAVNQTGALAGLTNDWVAASLDTESNLERDPRLVGSAGTPSSERVAPQKSSSRASTAIDWTSPGFVVAELAAAQSAGLACSDVATCPATGESHRCVCTSSTGGACNAYVRPFPNGTCSHRCLSCFPGCGSTCVVVFD